MDTRSVEYGSIESEDEENVVRRQRRGGKESSPAFISLVLVLLLDPFFLSVS